MTSVSALRFTDLNLKPPANMLTVDVECWHQIVCRNLTGTEIEPCESCHDATVELLDLFRDKGVHATFFVLGVMAQAFPDLVRRMDAEGHEVATHTHSHALVRHSSTERFSQEVEESVALLSRIVGKPVVGFRAPEFSIVETTLWALDILASLGIKYDSSIVPSAGSRYGIADFPKRVTKVETGNHSIIEVPPSVLNTHGWELPIAGGRYFRILPYRMIRAAVRRIHREGRPYVLYLHPYEYSSEWLSVSSFPQSSEMRTRVVTDLKWNMLRRTWRRKLTAILDDFPFSSIREVLEDAV